MTCLPIVTTPIGELTSDAQHIDCEPYSAKVTAATCVSRQRMHGKWIRIASRYSTGSGSKRLNRGRCGNCEHGRAVMERVGGEPPVATDLPRPIMPPTLQTTCGDTLHHVPVVGIAASGGEL